MQCQRCASPLDRPGDYCLVCRTANTEIVVLDLERDRATVAAIRDECVLGRHTVTTTPETDGELGQSELRSFAGQIVEEVRRKRPDEVYASGSRTVIHAVRAQLRYPLYRIESETPVTDVIDRLDEPELDVVEASVAEKLGGAHSTLIGGRTGREALEVVAAHPNVKKIVPGPIDAGGSGSRNGVVAKATRADRNGNVRLLLRDGSSVQENRIVTTAGERERGEVVRADLNEALTVAGLA